MSDVRRPASLRSSWRRGSALLFTLLGCLVVATLGVGTLLAVRIKRQSATAAMDGYQAALFAQAGIDMAFYRIDHDLDWRAKAVAGAWSGPQALGTGSYTITMVDPVDGDLADSEFDPVVITSEGIAGSARQMLRVRLDVEHPGLECLQSSIHANGDIQLKGVAAESDHWFTAHGQIVAEDDGPITSVVDADVAAAGGIQAKGSSVFNGATTLDVSWPLSSPDPNTVFDYYLAHGTHINILDLPLWGDNLLENGSVEGPPPDPPTTGWFAYGNCTITADGSKRKDGNYSCLATGRATPQDGPALDITNKIASGLTYEVILYAGSQNVDKIPGRLVIEYESSGEGLQAWSSDWVQLPKGKFATLASADAPLQPKSFTPTWTGSLLSATLRLETQSSLDDVRVDAASMVELTPYPFIRTIHRQVLSPEYNPFGTGTTNPEGIYIINAQGNILSIQRSRIVGTLVVLNPHNEGTFIWSVVHWSPAVSNYPAILSDGIINFWLGNEAETHLREGPANVNYNPVGATFNGGYDLDRDDTYGSLMRGIVYSSDMIRLKYRPVLEGVLITDGDLYSESTDLLGQTTFKVTYLSHFLNDAPPGFGIAPIYRIAPGSFKRVVD